MKVSTHNIFSIATKELSQDAFIAWVLHFASEDRNSTKNKRIWDFAQSMLNRFIGIKGDDHHFTVECVYTQYPIGNRKGSIDILVRCCDNNDNNKYAIIVEDKVNTTEHDNQLQRYYDYITGEINKEGSDFKDYNPIVVYYKTGAMLDEESLALESFQENRTLMRFGVRDISDLLDKVDICDDYDILGMYKKYIKDELANNNEAIEKLVNGSNQVGELTDSPLGTEYGQFCFLDSIFPNRRREINTVLQSNFETWKERNKKPSTFCNDCSFYSDYIYNGSSYGTPWTQYCFCGQIYEENDVADNNKPPIEELFWRLDNDRISLRYYIRCGLKNPENSSGTLSKMRAICKNIDDDNWCKPNRHATYEFSLLELKITPNDTYADLQKEIGRIHEKVLKQIKNQNIFNTAN